MKERESKGIDYRPKVWDDETTSFHVHSIPSTQMTVAFCEHTILPLIEYCIPFETVLKKQPFGKLFFQCLRNDIICEFQCHRCVLFTC